MIAIYVALVRQRALQDTAPRLEATRTEEIPHTNTALLNRRGDGSNLSAAAVAVTSVFIGICAFFLFFMGFWWWARQRGGRITSEPLSPLPQESDQEPSWPSGRLERAEKGLTPSSANTSDRSRGHPHDLASASDRYRAFDYDEPETRRAFVYGGKLKRFATSFLGLRNPSPTKSKRKGGYHTPGSSQGVELETVTRKGQTDQDRSKTAGTAGSGNSGKSARSELFDTLLCDTQLNPEPARFGRNSLDRAASYTYGVEPGELAESEAGDAIRRWSFQTHCRSARSEWSCRDAATQTDQTSVQTEDLQVQAQDAQTQTDAGQSHIEVDDAVQDQK